MRHFKYFIFVLTFMFLLGCSSSSLKKPDMTVAEDSIVYATGIHFELNELNVKIGDSIKMSDLKVNISPVNAKVTSVIELKPTNKVTISGDVVTFVEEGEVEFVAKTLSGLNAQISTTLKCVISQPDVYASSVEFEKTDVVVDLSETIVNKLIVAPANYNQDVEVSYVNNNVVANYDYVTGVITPIKQGTGTINVKVKSGKATTMLASFNVVVTNNVFAEQITNVKANNVMLGSEINLFVGEKGNLSYEIMPAAFNMLSFVSTSNNLITINESGAFSVGNTTGECEIVISAQTKTGYLTKSIKVNIVKEPETIEFELKYNNEKVTEFYANICYTAEILTPLQNYSNVTFENCEYEYVSNNIYKLTFVTAGNVSINANTTMFGTLSNKIINGTTNFRVYNAVTDVNFALMNNNNEILPSNDVYTIYLPKIDKLTEAIEQNELVYSDVYVGAKGLYINPNALTYNVEGDSIVLKGGRIVANKLGTSKIVVTSKDIGKFVKEYVVEVKPLEVREIAVDETEIELFLNGETGSNVKTLTPTMIPNCAYNTEYELVSSSNNISIYNNEITALLGGNAVVKIRSGNVEKLVNVTISYVPTHILVKLNNVEITDGDVCICEVNNINNLTASVYSNEILLANKTIVTTVNSNQVSSEEVSKLCFDEAGDYNVVVKHDSLSLSFTIKVQLINTISNFEFDEELCNVNMFFTKNIQLSYSYDVQYPSKPVSDKLTFSSSNSNVVALNGEILNVVGVGEAIVYAYVNDEIVDEFKVNVINKQINQINSLNDFYNIEDGKSYIVNSDLNFEGFSIGSGKSFNGEIDFNNKKITNLKTSMFDVLGNNSVISNLNFAGNIVVDSNSFVGDIDEVLALVATQNNGTINNVTFSNLTLTINNSQSKTSLISTLIAFNNYGTISNINYNNVKIIVSDTSASSVNGYIVSAGVFANYGTIDGVEGNVEFSGFTKVGGLVVNHYNALNNVTLNLVFNCTQENKIQIGSLVHRTCDYGETKPQFNAVNLTVTINNLSDCTDLKFGGLAFTNQLCEGDNISCDFTFNGSFSESKTFLMFYSNTLNNLKNVEIKSNIEFNY